MEFTTTSSKRRPHGFTLPEMLVAVGAGSLVLAAILGASTYTSRTLLAMVNYAEMEQENQRVLDTLTQSIRSADRITGYSANQLTLLSQGQTISYSYNAQGRSLSRSAGGTNAVLLTNVTSLSFSVYQRNVASNSFYQYLASGTNTAKAVIINWVSTADIGRNTQSDTVCNARVIVRNNPS